MSDAPTHGNTILDELAGAVEGYAASGGELPAFICLDETGRFWLTPDAGGGGTSPLCGWQCERLEDGGYKLKGGQSRLNFYETQIAADVTVQAADVHLPLEFYLTCSDAGARSVTTAQPSGRYVKLVEVTSDGRIYHYALGQTIDFVFVTPCPSS